ncbi:hypothetical protein F5888DRAFT_445282 [Russula emetica]|nr:hypothetical protein F5888DRAFT_445282 [Russula emetica]
MTPRSSGSAAPRSNRHPERSLSLQLVPRPPPAHSSHYRSPSPSRFPRFEETSVSEKSRCDGVIQSSPAKAEEASTSWADTPEPLSSHHLSRPSSESSLRHLTHQNSACPDYPLSPIPDTMSAHFAMPLPSLHSGYLHPPRKIRLWSIVKPWLPVLAYISTSLGFVIAIAFWKTHVFQALDNLSSWLKADKNFGYGVLFFLIFMTTFPPLPLYSTLIVLSGYTFGAWAGAVLSYCAALTGAFVVFMLSRSLFRGLITRWLSNATSVKRVVRAIEKRPQLLFLIRLAPYPYNVMNCLLGASPTLTLRTYLVCTALSLFKVIIHTTLGSSIHSFARYHTHPDHDTVPNGGQNLSLSDGDAGAEEEDLFGFYAKIVGVILAIGVFIYISVVARKAINDELDDDGDELPFHTDEEAVSFLSPGGIARQSEDERDPYVNARMGEPMSETLFYAPITPTSADAADAAAAVPRMRPSTPRGSRIGVDGSRNGATRDVRRDPREEGSVLH